MKSPGTHDQITFAECHLDWYEHMKTWLRPVTAPREWRYAFVSPRSSAKSTHWYLFAILWAAAHGHARFVAAFSDSAGQAETHLATFRHELETNTLLRRDFPDLCTPAKRNSGSSVSDNRQMLQTRSGFVMSAKGIDAASLGLKVGERRPDVLLLDDVEKGESAYSLYGVEQRRKTLQDVILPLNEYARVVLVGTVTRAESLVHQLVKPAYSAVPPEPWVLDEGFITRYYPAILRDDAGQERSLWPELWSLEFLRSIRHTRSYAKNYDNRPVPEDGAYWVQEDFTYGHLQAATRVICSIDPAVTTRKSSDQTAISIVAYSPSEGKCEVRAARGVRLRGDELRQAVLAMLAEHQDVARILVEVNQGGDLWLDVLHDLPVPLYTVNQSIKKEVRAAQLLNHYQHGRVLHAQPLPDLEQQELEFPLGMHDDLIDSVGSAVAYLLKPAAQGASARATSYV